MRWLWRLSLYVFVLLVLFFAWVNLAHAGYAALNPPPGFSAGAVGSASNPLTYTRTAANAPWVNGTAVGNVTANVGGRAVTMPAQARMAANAARFAVTAVRLNPTALAVGAVAAWLLPYGLQWVEEAQEWRIGDGTTYSPTYYQAANGGLACRGSSPSVSLIICGLTAQHSTGAWSNCAITSQGPPTWSGGCNYSNGNWLTQSIYTYTCPAPYVYLPATKTCGPNPGEGTREPTEDDWDDIANDPLPDAVPNSWPHPDGLPLPVELPKVNPSPAPNPEPNPAAVPAPMRVPTGDPVPIPDTDPQKWEKPWIDIIPSPTPSDPWRVDVRPGKDVDEDPDPLEDPEGTRSDPDKPREEETVSPPADPSMPPVPDLYERKYPDGIAGVWATHKDALTSGPLGTFLASLVPGFGVGGCPSFALPNATVLGVAVGGDFALPCEVWSFVRLVMIISALLLARRLVFGG